MIELKTVGFLVKSQDLTKLDTMYVKKLFKALLRLRYIGKSHSCYISIKFPEIIHRRSQPIGLL